MSFADESGVPNIGLMISKLIYELGGVLVADDIHDYGKFDHVHHWFVGELFRQLGKQLGGALVGLSIFGEMKKNEIKTFPLTTDDEARLDKIIEDCVRRKEKCHT
jgi:hypothetical protein